ncbi:hypothetical protein U8527_09955 [Kordia algicida OT-1]|uniref:Uncharacterized protein n=1 Tax=Kordia algicida OT-1 TaxID=391587 RepID=A9DVI5_9FLAO|nr:hypothetical protein [Kordia algicida]EDP96426.1 hypothetical protein KAOT1_03417 [Kordia algicida OT-1]
MKKTKNIKAILGSKVISPLDEVIGGIAGCSPMCDNPTTQCQCQGQQQQLPSEPERRT